jgi:hypothetical protein
LVPRIDQQSDEHFSSELRRDLNVNGCRLTSYLPDVSLPFSCSPSSAMYTPPKSTADSVGHFNVKALSASAISNPNFN